MSRTRKIAMIIAVIFCFALNSCRKNADDTPLPDPVVVPELTINDVSQPRTADNSTMHFYVSLSKTTNKAVSFDYSLADGTAVSPKDYMAASGTITVPAGQNEAIIDVAILGDPTNLRQDNLEFTVRLSNPKFRLPGSLRILDYSHNK